MNTRLQQFLAAENISQSQFADTLGVAKASVSHILAGRNKPGFEFIESMARHYPDLNLEWFISGKGKMYKSASSQESSHKTLNAEKKPAASDLENEDDLFPDYPRNEILPAENEELQPADDRQQENRTYTDNKRKPRIVKVLAFYDNGTYKEIE